MGILFQLALSLLLLFVITFIYEYVYKLYSTINFYKAQGVTILPRAGIPFLGNLIDYIDYEAEAKVSDEPLPSSNRWMMCKLLGKGEERFKPEDHKVILN